SGLVSEEKPRQSRREFGRGGLQVNVSPRSCRKLELKIITEVAMVFAQRLDDQEVDREPDRASPVRVPPVDRTARLARLVGDHTAEAREGMGFVFLGERADSVIGEELIRVEQASQDALQLVSVGEGQQAMSSSSRGGQQTRVGGHHRPITQK